MKKLNKKAFLFNISLVLITIVVLTTSLIILKPLTAKGITPIGGRQFNITKKYFEAEQALLYTDEAARLSSETALFHLLDKGGFAITQCEPYENYIIWNKEKDCYPDYKTSFKQLLNNNLNTLLSNYKDPAPPKNNYIYTIIDTNIVGTAISGITFSETAEDKIEYTVKPSFNVKIPYNLEEFSRVIDSAKGLVTACNDKSSEQELKQCIEQNLPKSWKLGPCEGELKIDSGKVQFCIDTGKKIVTSLGIKPLQYKFALYFQIKPANP